MRSVPNPMPLPADDARTVLPRLVRAASITLVALLPIVVTPWGTDAYSQVKALTMYALAGLATLGGVGARLTTGRPKWKLTAPELPVWAFLLALLLSTVTSVDARLSFFGAPIRHEGLFADGSYIALFFVGAHFFGSARGVRDLALAGGAAAAITIAYGLAQTFLPPLFAGEAFMREWYGGLGFPRIPSTIGGPAVFGGYLATMIPLLLALSITAAGRSRLLWFVAACLAIPALALTLTRAAWAAVGGGLAVFAVALGRAMWRRHRLAIIALGLALVVSSVLLVTVVGTPAQIGSRVSTSVERESGSLAQHLYIWDRTLHLIRLRPWLGWGLETLGAVFPYDRPSLVRHFGVRPAIIDRAHNDLLQMAVSIGIPGALAYAAVWVAGVATAFRLWRRQTGPARVLAAGWLGAIVAYLIQVQFSFSSVALAPIVWLLAGSAAGWEAEARDAESSRQPSGKMLA